MSKILLYQPYYHFPGHFKSQFLAFHKHLTSLGFSCTGLVGLWHQDYIERSVDVSSFHYKTRNRTLRIFANIHGFTNIRHLLKQESFTTIHFLDTEIFLLFLFVRFNRHLFDNVRIVVTQHSINRLQNDSLSFSANVYRWIIRKSYSYLQKNCNLKVLTNGQNITNWLIKEQILFDSTIETVWWGSSFNNVNPDFSSKKPDSFLLYGILRKDKNIEFLLEVFSKIKHPFHLHIAGYPRDYTSGQLHDLLEKYGFSNDNITLEPGYLTEERIAELLKASSFILLPYSEKNLSNSGPLIDAIQFGCIPIASGYGERREWINTFDAGYLFYFDKDPSLTDTLTECLTNSDRNNHYKEVLSKVKNQFTWESIINDLVTVKKIYK